MKVLFILFFVFNVSLINVAGATSSQEENLNLELCVDKSPRKLSSTSLDAKNHSPLAISDQITTNAIVFVHIGIELPDYLSIAVEQARLFNQNTPIYIIGNKSAFQKFRFTFDENVYYVFCEDLTTSDSHQTFIALSNLNKEVFQGFWRFTSERFFYLEEFVREYNLENVFHLENDIMLYVDLIQLMPVFKKSYSNMIAATFDSDTRCVPGFMYISNIHPLAKLVKLMASQASTGKNDMEMFQEFKNQHYQFYIDHLPIINPQYEQDHGLKNALNATAEHPEMYFRFFEDFQSIFDAAAIGQYLGGISPRNGSGPPGFINETCFFNPSYLSFTWKEDFKGRWVPYIIYKNAEYRINNLHIHSKNLDNFYSKFTK